MIDMIETWLADFFKLLLPVSLAILAAYITIQQVRLNNINQARLDWLNKLKENFSIYLKSVDTFINRSKLLKSFMTGVKHSPDKDVELSRTENLIDFYKSLEESNDIIRLSENSLRVNLNESEDLHRITFFYLDRIRNEMHLLSNKDKTQDRKRHLIKIRNSKLVIEIIARKISKLEWEKVKQGKNSYDKWYKEWYEENKGFIYEHLIVMERNTKRTTPIPTFLY